MAARAISPTVLQRAYLVSWWFADFGGMERHIVELAKALQGRGVAVTVFTEMPVPRNNQYRRELRQAGIPFVTPWIPRGLAIWWQSRFPSSNAAPPAKHPVSQAMGRSFLARLLKFTLERRLQRETPDVVHVHGWLLSQWVVTWCAARGIPSIYTEHSTISDWGGTGLAAPALMAGAGDVACVSESARRSLEPWLPGRSIALHRHIVRLPACSSTVAPSEILRLISVARLRSEKGLDILLRAAAQLRSQSLNFRLEIAGDGPMRRELLELRRELGLDDCVVFSGGSSARGIREKLCQADSFILPSRTEAMPLALLEAMSHGLAIVATAAGGIPEVVFDGETGLLVPPESVGALAQAIGRIAADRDLRAQLGVNARKQLASGPYSEVAGVDSVLASYGKARSAVQAS